MIGAVSVAVGIDSCAARRRPSWSPWVGVGVAMLLIAPLQGGAAMFLGLATYRFRTASNRTRLRREESDACFEATELVALGLAGGLSVGAAHHMALLHVAPGGATALGALVHEIEDDGIRAALRNDEGPMRQGSRVLATAVDSGAAALPALSAFLETEEHRRHSERVEAVRRLPVRLLLPLTLLVLPGFVVMTVGPTVIESLARLNP